MSEIAQSIIMFKPDARDITFTDISPPRLLHQVGAALLVASGIEIIQYSQKVLRPDDVRRIYAKALAPNPADEAIWGTAWKEEVVRHVSSGLVDSYLLEDVDGVGIEIVRDMKEGLRRHYGKKNNVVQNIAHVPDEDELDMVKAILFQ